MALLLLCFTQCKPSQEEGGDENTQKVRVSCVIPINDDGDKSDFTHLMTDGQINWSDGRECVYLAIPGNEPKGIKPQIIELEGWSDGYYSKIEFGGEIDKNLIISGQEYDLWYFGNSQQAVIHYVELTNEGTSVKGSIANQSGRLEDLGYYHIAKTKVTAVIENDGIKLNIKGFLKSQIAIALLDLENASVLCGSAIRGTEYILEYNVISEKYELNDIVGKSGIGKGTDGKLLVVLESCIDTEHTPNVPVTIDVFRHSCPTTGCIIILTNVANGILSKRTVQRREDTTLRIHIEGIEVHVHVMRERRLQTWITGTNIQRIRVISDRQQVFHAWIAGTSAI